MASPHMRTEKTTSKEASLCNNSLVFLLCGGLRNYESIRTVAVGEKLACWTVGFNTAGLNFNNSWVSPINSLPLRTVAGRFWPFRGEQTVENHLVHTGTSLYQHQCTHIMMSSIFTFLWFLFCRSRSVHENREKLHPAKIFRYTVLR